MRGGDSAKLACLLEGFAGLMCLEGWLGLRCIALRRCALYGRIELFCTSQHHVTRSQLHQLKCELLPLWLANGELFCRSQLHSPQLHTAERSSRLCNLIVLCSANKSASSKWAHNAGAKPQLPTRMICPKKLTQQSIAIAFCLPYCYDTIHIPQPCEALAAPTPPPRGASLLCHPTRQQHQSAAAVAPSDKHPLLDKEPPPCCAAPVPPACRQIQQI